LNGVQFCGPAFEPSAYVASMVASWSPLKAVPMANELVVPCAPSNTGVSKVITWNFHGTPRENRAERTALTPYALSPVSRPSAAAENVSLS
jgi:hypothetical protein